MRAANRRSVQHDSGDPGDPGQPTPAWRAGLPPIEKVVRTHQDEVTAALIAGEVDATDR